MSDQSELPLAGICVIEFAHMVMGPSCGMILADMGAEVIKVEPQGIGDKTRGLKSFGTGFHATFNRNKKSMAVDLRSAKGKAVILELIRSADVVTENFRQGALEKLGLGYEALSAENPRLVYCSMKGFLSGPYENRAALDEVVQMMGGLAFMTGPAGHPSRAGASVNDIMGGMFAVIGILGALRQREASGRGCHVTSGLFESCALLMAQHIAKFAATGEPSQPLFDREDQPWPVYELFDTKSGDQIFVGLVTDGHWASFCEEFGLDELRTDPTLQDNAGRVSARSRVLPVLQELFRGIELDDLEKRLDKLGCPFAPVRKPEDLIDDIHLNVSGGLLDIEVAAGKRARLPGLPLQYGSSRFGVRRQPPLVGEHTREVLRALGQNDSEIDELIESGVVSESQR